MAVIRVNKTTDYTIMSNFHLKDKRLSLKAKGLLSLILSLPNDWNYTIGGLISLCVENESAVKSALSELKKYGYLQIDKFKPTKENGGRFEYVYNIYEHPKEKQEVEIQDEEKQEVEIQGVENQPLEILPLENDPLYKDTNKLNTNNKNTNISNKDNREKERMRSQTNKGKKKPARHKYGEYQNVLLSDDDMEKLKNEFPIDYETRIERLSEYIASTGKSYKNHLATIRSWARKDKRNQNNGNYANGLSESEFKEKYGNWETIEV